MRHRLAGKTLGRDSSHRRAMMRNMVTSLFKHEQILTTDARAKALRQVAEKMITLAKRGDLHARRQALAFFQEKTVAHRLFDEMKGRFADRQGGHLRIVKKTTRKGDCGSMSIVQLVTAREEQKPPKKEKKSKKAAKQDAKTPGSKKAAKEASRAAAEPGPETAAAAPTESKGEPAPERDVETPSADAKAAPSSGDKAGD